MIPAEDLTSEFFKTTTGTKILKAIEKITAGLSELEQILRDVGKKQLLDANGEVLKTEPKKPKTAFILFAKEKRVELAKDPRFADVKELAMELGRKWQAMTDADRAPYVKEHEEQMKEYQRQLSRQKKPKQRDPMKPKAPPSSYLQFTQDISKELLKKPEFKGADAVKLSSEIARLWKELDQETKKKYDDTYQKLVSVYRVQMQEYRYKIGKDKSSAYVHDSDASSSEEENGGGPVAVVGIGQETVASNSGRGNVPGGINQLESAMEYVESLHETDDAEDLVESGHEDDTVQREDVPAQKKMKIDTLPVAKSPSKGIATPRKSRAKETRPNPIGAPVRSPPTPANRADTPRSTRSKTVKTPTSFTMAQTLLALKSSKQQDQTRSDRTKEQAALKRKK